MDHSHLADRLIDHDRREWMQPRRASWLILALGQLLQDLLKHLSRVVLTALTARRFVLFAHSLERSLDEAAAHVIQFVRGQFAQHISLLL